jgi:hypothetical protein
VALGSQQRRAALLKRGVLRRPDRPAKPATLQGSAGTRDRPRQAHADTIVLIYIDLDRFKNVNDSMGHSAGDELLRGVSEQLVSQLREATRWRGWAAMSSS